MTSKRAAPAPLKKINLVDWASAQFAHVPHVNTLRKWAHEGYIEPKPEKVGREYLVLPTARYVGKQAAK